MKWHIQICTCALIPCEKSVSVADCPLASLAVYFKLADNSAICMASPDSGKQDEEKAATSYRLVRDAVSTQAVSKEYDSSAMP